MPNIATHIETLLKKTERMKQQTVKSLHRTLKQIEKERKKRTADLEEGAKLILKQLGDLGHVGMNSEARKTRATTTIGKGKRRRRKFAVSDEQSISIS
jgi:hypothetical protein